MPAATGQAGPGVDIVLDDPYRLPFGDGEVDVVVSGQMLEHCEFFWLSFGEMLRILKPDGYLFLIVPSAGPIHNYPVDCYRFYPDAMKALAKYTGLSAGRSVARRPGAVERPDRRLSPGRRAVAEP